MQKTHTSWMKLKASILRLDGKQLRSLTFAQKAFDAIAKWRTLQQRLFACQFFMERNPL
jgi:hypothetical protein